MLGNKVYSRDMNTTSNTTDHHADCNTHNEQKPGAIDLGCTCNWTDEDQAWLEKVSN